MSARQEAPVRSRIIICINYVANERLFFACVLAKIYVQFSLCLRMMRVFDWTHSIVGTPSPIVSDQQTPAILYAYASKHQGGHIAHYV